MANQKISARTVLAGTGLISTPAVRAGSTTDYRIVDNLSATTDPGVGDDSGDGYHVGSRWFNTSAGRVWMCTDATLGAAVWKRQMVVDDNLAGLTDTVSARSNIGVGYGALRNRFYTFNDCVVAQPGGSEHWIHAWSGTGAIVNSVAVGSLNALGIVSLELGTTTTGSASVYSKPSSGAASSVKLGLGRARFAAKHAVHTLSDGTNTYTTRLGFIDSNSGESTDGVFFRYTDGVNAGKWQAVCRSNGTETTADTGITPVADTWHLFEIDVNADGTSVSFSIDSSVVATITTNIPTGAGRETGYGAMALKSAGTTSTSGGYIDYMEIEYLFTSSR